MDGLCCAVFKRGNFELLGTGISESGATCGSTDDGREAAYWMGSLSRKITRAAA